MDKKKIIISILLVVIIIALIVAIFIMVRVNNTKRLEVYQGYWYPEKENQQSIEFNELNIKEVDNNTITFDYMLSMICTDNDIEVKIKNGEGNFKTQKSEGTIKLEKNKVQLTVKNSDFEQVYEKEFDYKSSNRRNVDWDKK